MIVKKFTLFALAAAVVGISFFSLSSTEESKYFPRESNINNASSADAIIQFREMMTANQVTRDIDPADVIQAKSHIGKMRPSKAALNVNWAFKGPDNIGGRTRAIIIDRNNSNHIIAAGVSGGVFESFDAANSWQPYDPEFKVAYVSSITQDAAGDFYIGTGGHFEGGNNNKARSSAFVGSGVHRLTGNGNYETIRRPDTSFSVSYGLAWASVGNMAAHPTIPGKIYCAASQGFVVLERNGNTWTESTPINFNAKCLDVNISDDGNSFLVTFDPSSGPSRVYASSDNMQTWDSTNFSASRIEGAIAPSNPSVMYLSAIANSNCLYNIYRSSDAGKNWSIIGPGGSSSFDMFANIGFNCQGYYDNLLAVVPDNPGKIFVGGIRLSTWEQSSTDPAPPNGSWRSIDVTVNRIDIGFADPRYVHADKHNMVFDPNNSDIAYIATDGGVAKSTNINDIQPNYIESNNNFGVTQYYNIDVNSNDVVIGGTQDNGTHLVGLKYNTNRSGLEIQGGDGFGCEMSVINPQIGVSSLYFNIIRRVQGIGTTLGNNNISRADIISNNTFFGGLCNQQTCRGPFYTTMAMWESFNHEGSRDSVEVLYERRNLPPIPKDTIIQFEGNNNNILQIDSLREDAFPFDTANGGVDTTNLEYRVGVRNSVIANFDTIYFDRPNHQIAVRRRMQSDTSINYTVGATYTISNVVSAPFRTTIQVTSDSTISVRRPQITFRYRIFLHDKVQNILASANWAGLDGTVNTAERNIIITRDLLKNTPDIKWFNIAGRLSTPDPIVPNNTVIAMEFSADGNYLFAGTSLGDVFRISDLNSVYYIKDTVEASTGSNLYRIQQNRLAGKCRKIGRFTGRSVTDISVDPNDPNNVIVALGNYGNTAYVARTNIALTATDPTSTFEVIQGTGNTQLPFVPSYSVIIDKNDHNRVFLGTEFGVFATDNAFSAAATDVDWYEENIGMGRVPVYDLEQMVFDFDRASNDGKIYAGTHGRGIFETDQFTSVQNLKSEARVKTHFENGLKIYPNPVRDFAKVEYKLAENASVRVQIYSLNGRLIRDEQYANQSEGTNTIQLDLTGYSNGSYIIRAISGDKVSSSKMLIYK